MPPFDIGPPPLVFPKPAIIRPATEDLIRHGSDPVARALTAHGLRRVSSGGNDAFVKALLHFDGSDGSTTFTDSSASAHTFSATNQAQIDTAQFKFGTGSLLLDGTADRISAPDHADWTVGASDFTVDLWFRWNAFPTANNFVNFCQQGWGDSNQLNFFFGANANSSGVLRLFHSWTANGSTQVQSSKVIDPAPSLNTWYHYALVRSGTLWRAFSDGVQQGTDGDANGTYFSSTSSFHIGAQSDGALGVNGWMDEFRFSKGIARWSGNFIPPTGPYYY